VIHVVDVDADRRLERIAEIDLIEPAQADRIVRAEVTRVAPEVRVRNREADVLDVLDATELELLARERRDCDRRRLDIFLSIARRDEYLLETSALRLSVCCKSDRAECRGD
jgi:hypothetical protein